MRIIVGICVLSCSVFNMSKADALVHIDIDLSSQTMHVTSDEANYDWRVSTARSGYATPRGHYRPTHLLQMHYSHKYHMSPMPYSIFFNGGYAIHGTYSTAELGRPASHGCIRLARGNAARLFAMVKNEGARITISGAPPRTRFYALRRRKYATYARLHRWRGFPSAYAARRGNRALAYAPARRAPVSVRVWQTNPAVRLLPGALYP